VRSGVAALAAALAGVGAALGVAACGGDDEIPPTITTNLPGAVATATTSSTGSTLATTPSAPASTAAATSTGTTANGESGPGGAGDEQGTRVPAVYTLKGGALAPKTVNVPAFLAAEVTVSSTDSRAHTVTVKVGKGYPLAVPPRGSESVRVPGQKGGRHEVLLDGKPAATLAWGGEPGP
jgi:cytoskeletal protein RodZ